MTKREFVTANRRRIFLIMARHAGGLTETEATELEQLNRVVVEHLRREAPRSREALEEFEAYVAILRDRKL
jgi:hypothetical protein